MPAPLAATSACVFDAYGTLFDFLSASKRCRDALGDKADALGQLWRTRQLEYSWLRSLMGAHADFWRVTGEALDFAMASLGIKDAALRDRVLAGAAAALVPGGTLLVVGHDLTNLTEGVGGPQTPEVLYTPEAITAGLPGLRILRAERVRRTVERDGGRATAIDTLLRAERPAG